MIEITWLALILIVALDLVVISVRASFTNLHIPELNDLRGSYGQAVDRTLTLIEKVRFRASIRMSTGIAHFLVAVVIFSLLELYKPDGFSLAANLGIALASAIFFIVLEYTFEGRFSHHAEIFAIRLTPLASFINLLLTPFTFLMVRLGGQFNPPPDITSPVIETALRNWAQDGKAESSLEQGERKMIYSIFQFRNTLAREIMVPRIDMTAIEINTPFNETVDLLSKTGHSRVPVYAETIDDIVGMLYAKDLLQVKEPPISLAALRPRLRPPYYVPETKKVDELLTEMQTRRIHVAIVVDEYGGVAGLVTLEDIVEEIVGEIRDEYDQAEEQLYQQVGVDEYLFQGKISLDDFNDVMGTHLEKDDADSLGGYIYRQMGRVPIGGERITLSDLTLTVEQISGRRIRKVRAQRIQPAQEKEIENSNADR